jgi:hypothetical protein
MTEPIREAAPAPPAPVAAPSPALAVPEQTAVGAVLALQRTKEQKKDAEGTDAVPMSEAPLPEAPQEAGP